MVGVAKKLMDKAGSEGKPWISGLYEYRVTPQSGSIASPLQLLTQRIPREKDLPQLPSTLGAQEMYDTHQEILRRQPDRPERSYIELTPGMAVWVQHKQNTSWEPAIIASQTSPNSYWIMQENGDDQPKLYRRTRSMLKIRCTEVRKPSLEYNQPTEMNKAKFPFSIIHNKERNHVRHNSVDEIPRDLFQRLKMEISKTEALPYFNTSAETTLQTDASKKGLGACLIQNGKVVCYASRSLTKTEQNYQNLEREALGTIWGMEKFHYFLYGKEFTLETDQKPLVSIYKKHMVDISPRVQRLIVRSFPYQPFTVVYKKGRDIPVADALSRVTPMDPEDNIKLPIIAINMITKLVLMSTFAQDNFSRKLDRIRKSTLQDNQLTRLSRYINTGFPCEKKNLPRDLQDYWNYRDTLSIENGLITCGSRIIVPHEMRAEMMQYIHEGHQGKERCLLRARNTVFWPRISYDIQELIERCIICQEHGKSQPIVGITQELPPFPWHTLATDIFYWKRMDFLIVADVFSKYFLIRKLINSTSTAVCAEIATIVTELGLPHVIRSDNGPCYSSKEFQQMLQ